MLDKVSEPGEIGKARQKIAAIGPKFDPDILETDPARLLPACSKAKERRENLAGHRLRGGSAPATRSLSARSVPPARSSFNSRWRICRWRQAGRMAPTHRNLGNYFAVHGILTVVANYRLAPITNIRPPPMT